MSKIKKADARQFSVSFPKSFIEEIDIICKAEFTSRSSWLFAAAKEKIERERIKKMEKFKKDGDNMSF